MAPPVKPRPYDASSRRARAEDNRRAVLRSAHALFLEHGYARTSVAAVAAAAGVSADLVYKAFGSKRQLVVEVMNLAASGEVDGPPVLEQHGPQAVRAETDQRRQLRMFADDIAGRTARVRPVDDVVRSAGEVDAGLAAQRVEMQQTRLANLRVLVDWLMANGPLRDGLDPDDAAATVWTLTGPDQHRLLVDDLGWSDAHYRAWLASTLEAALLPPG